MRVLGIDPGTATTGYGVVDQNKGKTEMFSYGIISTAAKTDPAERLEKIYDQMQDLLIMCKPDIVVIEQLFFHSNAKTVIQVGQARGVILLACKKANVEIAEYTPLQVKSAITGYGRAEKAQIQLMVKMMLHLKEIPKPDDSADALAFALCHLRSSNILNNYNKKK